MSNTGKRVKIRQDDRFELEFLEPYGGLLNQEHCSVTGKELNEAIHLLNSKQRGTILRDLKAQADAERIASGLPAPSGEVMSLEECRNEYAINMGEHDGVESVWDAFCTTCEQWGMCRDNITSLVDTIANKYAQQFKDKSAALEQELKYLQNLYDSEQRHSAAQEKSIETYQKIADKFIEVEKENNSLKQENQRLKADNEIHLNRVKTLQLALRRCGSSQITSYDGAELNEPIQQTDNDKT